MVKCVIKHSSGRFFNGVEGNLCILERDIDKAYLMDLCKAESIFRLLSDRASGNWGIFEVETGLRLGKEVKQRD